MHGKNMLRATRECNMKFMAKIFPIVKNFKYKDIQLYCDQNNGEGFTQIIKNFIDKCEKTGRTTPLNNVGRLPDTLGDNYDWLDSIGSAYDMGLL